MGIFARKEAAAPSPPPPTYGPSVDDDADPFLWSILDDIDLGYIATASAPARDLVQVLQSQLRTEKLAVPTEPGLAERGCYEMQRSVFGVDGRDLGWKALLFALEAQAGDESMVILFVPGTADEMMAALYVDVKDRISVGRIRKDLRGEWYLLSKNRVCPGGTDVAQATRADNPHIKDHDIGRRLTTFVPAKL